MARTSYHHGDLRNSLVEAAIALMVKHGVAHLSLREVAKAAGVSSAAPYRHFKDKTALMEAIAAVGYQKISHANVQAVIQFPDDPAAQLRAAGLAYLHFAAENPEIVTLMFGGAVSLDDCGETLGREAQEAFDSLAGIVENGQTSGVFRKADIHNCTVTSFAIVHGLAMMFAWGPLQHQRGDTCRVDELGQLAADMLLEGMLDN